LENHLCDFILNFIMNALTWIIRASLSVLYAAFLASADTMSRPAAFSSNVPQPTFHEAAVSALKSHHYDEALHFLNKASAELYNTMGVTFKLMGKYESALDHFMSAIRLSDGFHSNYNAANLLHMLYDNEKYRKRQVLDNAILLYDKALVLSMEGKDGGVSNSIKAQIYMELAEALRKLKRMSESTMAMTKAAALDPSHVNDLGNSAVKLFNDGYIHEALSAASAAVELNPSQSVFRRNYEAILQELQKKKHGDM
jgi:tetratricopeptide (TPR) repeat protein